MTRTSTGKYVACVVCGKEFWKVPSRTQRYCSRDCMYPDKEYRDKLKSMDKSYMQTEAYSISKRKEDTPEYTRYKNKVHRLTQRVYEDNIDIINPNRHKRTLAGVEGGWQLDHIIEVRFGFDNNIPPEVIADVENLRMLPWKMNLRRNRGKS